MARDYSEFYTRKQEYLTEHVESGAVSKGNADAIRELCAAFDENRPTTQRPRWPDASAHLTKVRSESTLANWMYHLTTYSREVDLLDTTAHELNQIAEDWLNGDSEIKDGGISKGTIRVYQNTARIFYRYYDDVGVDYEDIVVFAQNDDGIDPRDMLTREELHRARDVITSPRDKCIFDLLIYCGMRNNALRTLRVRDMDLQNEQWHFNTDADNLKNINKPHAPRPLLGATSAVREWLDYHPYSDDPDSYLITAKPKWSTVDPAEPVSDKTIQRVLQSIKEDAEIDKPMHPHMLRHNFVTLCKREHGMDDGTIKFLIGHSPDSSVMETTYAHLSGEDYVKKARVATGRAEPDDESTLTPDTCNICDEPLAPDAKACPGCGTTYHPDAKSKERDIEDAMYADKGAAETDEEDHAVNAFREALQNNPELKEILLNTMNDESESFQ